MVRVADFDENSARSNARASEPRGTQVVGRVFDILEIVTRADHPLTVTEISRSVGLKYSTTHRILDAMAYRGMVSRDPDSRGYGIGSRLREFALSSVSRIDVLSHAHPFLQALSERLGETTHLAVLDDGLAHYLDTVESSRMLSQHSHVRERVPAHCTGVGKALIAELPEAELEPIVSRGLARHTKNTIAERDSLLAELARVRKLGYAVDDEEMESGLVCVAAPVRDRFGRVVAAMSIGGPGSRLREIGIPAVAAEVQKAANGLAAALGWTIGSPGAPAAD